MRLAAARTATAAAIEGTTGSSTPKAARRPAEQAATTAAQVRNRPTHRSEVAYWPGILPVIQAAAASEAATASMRATAVPMLPAAA